MSCKTVRIAEISTKVTEGATFYVHPVMLYKLDLVSFVKLLFRPRMNDDEYKVYGVVYSSNHQ